MKKNQQFPGHPWTLFANSTIKWHGSDSESLFETHKKNPNKNKLLEQFGWNNAEIQYRFNSQGFRCDEFDDRPCAIALGCSHTHGTGLKESDAWPSKLSQKLNLHVWNLGISGAAYDTVFRLAQFYIPFLKPQFVFVLDPPVTRLEYCTDGVYKVAAVTNSFPELIDNTFIKYWFLNDENSLLNATRNCLAVTQVCHNNNAQFIHGPHGIMDWNNPVDLARDLMHPGVTEQEKVVDHMLQEINKKATQGGF